MSKVIKATYVRIDADPIHIEAPPPILASSEEEKEIELGERLRLRLERVQQMERSLEEQRQKLLEETAAERQASQDELKQLRQKQQVELITEREAILKQAQEDGYQAGQKKGREEGLASVTDQLEAAEEMLQEAAKEAERRVLDSERIILELVFALCSKILETELSSNEELVLQQIRQALGRFRQVPQVILKVPQERYSLVQSRLSKLKEEYRQVLALDCIQDPTLPLTDIVVDSPFGMVDVRFDAQLEILREALEELLSERQP